MSSAVSTLVLLSALTADTPPAALVELENAFVEAIAQAERSVVGIARVRGLGPGFDPSRIDPTRGDFNPMDVASGVIIDPNGLILTNDHVVAETSALMVSVADGRVFQGARLLAADPRSDLAVIQIEASGLPSILLGQAELVRKGQFVIALGNPYGSAGDGHASASWGIVSNLGRRQLGSNLRSTIHYFGTLIQTDARLHAGTSGGALINLRGEMIGLTTSLADNTGFDLGLGYAIPMNAPIRRIVETLKAGKEYEYGFLGISLPQEQISPAKMAALGLPQRGAVSVGMIEKGTPAYTSGLQPGDWILAVDGQPIHDADTLIKVIGMLPVEQVCKFTIIRPGASSGEKPQPFELEVSLAKYGVPGRVVATSRDDLWRGLRVDYGSVLVTLKRSPDISPQLQKALADMPAGGALLVTEVASGSPADQAGLRKNMLIFSVGRRKVWSPREFRRVVAELNGPVLLETNEGAFRVETE